ncbi:FKBP-type peptidyl-prolyl cis-trans isomerase [Mucilaginibacter sp. UR6-11]|uniref:FKBP-type peptidyl-prolyl cis-trans isomerase n=1 Tax=Mucilaginibacter sp. UR6-11 TaxID=1435644 RepID=UPI001E36494E|nr:FKBP-type peptidyl-prolyl cis-trans isomerase [Mucilaginibacter sp. UR6-11]MCC8424469.1 FKBP-type peptidyl-prolyl cis-trans isomerase [Mucilaginibacter sp. UR6-11]
MKKHLILFSLLVIGLSACQKIDSKTQAVTQASVDDAKIQAYIKANKITATKDASGIYYNIISPGTDPKPTLQSTVKLTYSDYYLNGILVGKVSGVQAKLSAFIAGLQTGVAKIGTGGRIYLIIPSGQAYGTGDQNGIPGNSVLTYTVDLDGVTAN